MDFGSSPPAARESESSSASQLIFGGTGEAFLLLHFGIKSMSVEEHNFTQVSSLNLWNSAVVDAHENAMVGAVQYGVSARYANEIRGVPYEKELRQVEESNTIQGSIFLPLYLHKHSSFLLS